MSRVLAVALDVAESALMIMGIVWMRERFNAWIDRREQAATARIKERAA